MIYYLINHAEYSFYALCILFIDLYVHLTPVSYSFWRSKYA